MLTCIGSVSRPAGIFSSLFHERRALFRGQRDVERGTVGWGNFTLWFNFTQPYSSDYQRISSKPTNQIAPVNYTSHRCHKFCI